MIGFMFGFLTGDFVFWVAKGVHDRGSDLIDVDRIGVVSVIDRIKHKTTVIGIYFNPGSAERGGLDEKFCSYWTSWGCLRGSVLV